MAGQIGGGVTQAMNGNEAQGMSQVGNAVTGALSSPKLRTLGGGINNVAGVGNKIAMDSATKAFNSGGMPSWMTAPSAGSRNTMATQEHTNPITGETWMANSGGYSVKPTWDGDSFSQHSGKSYAVDPNNPNNYIGKFRDDYVRQPGDSGYIGTGAALLPPPPQASGGGQKLTPELRALFDPSKETATEFVARNNIDPNMGYSPKQVESIKNTPTWTNDGLYNPADSNT